MFIVAFPVIFIFGLTKTRPFGEYCYFFLGFLSKTKGKGQGLFFWLVR